VTEHILVRILVSKFQEWHQQHDIELPGVDVDKVSTKKIPQIVANECDKENVLDTLC
jgi:hypothetical protein